MYSQMVFAIIISENLTKHVKKEYFIDISKT